jgi:hypothetical protein
MQPSHLSLWLRPETGSKGELGRLAALHSTPMDIGEEGFSGVECEGQKAVGSDPPRATTSA